MSPQRSAVRPSCIHRFSKSCQIDEVSLEQVHPCLLMQMTNDPQVDELPGRVRSQFRDKRFQLDSGTMDRMSTMQRKMPQKSHWHISMPAAVLVARDGKHLSLLLHTTVSPTNMRVYTQYTHTNSGNCRISWQLSGVWRGDRGALMVYQELFIGILRIWRQDKGGKWRRIGIARCSILDVFPPNPLLLSARYKRSLLIWICLFVSIVVVTLLSSEEK